MILSIDKNNIIVFSPHRVSYVKKEIVTRTYITIYQTYKYRDKYFIPMPKVIDVLHLMYRPS